MLKKTNIVELLAPHPPRKNFNVFWVDGEYTLRVAKVKGTFPWHHHPNSDEGWFVYQGQVTIQTRQADIPLGAGEALLIPKGLVHAPRADVENSIVMIINGRRFETIFEGAQSLADVGYSEQDVPGSQR
ncbi:MAG: cupin domain-containing protein [Acidobacteriia bacterium]|nr:cupin domain-containing protein [Terriglobia bacterium]